MDGKEFVEQYRDRGYFIVDDAVEPDLLDLLEAAARRVVDNIRSGAVVDDEAGMRTGGEGVEPQFVSGLIAPEFGDAAADRNARDILRELFADREIIQLNIDGIAAGGGGIHCTTQQQPRS